MYKQRQNNRFTRSDEGEEGISLVHFYYPVSNRDLFSFWNILQSLCFTGYSLSLVVPQLHCNSHLLPMSFLESINQSLFTFCFQSPTILLTIVWSAIRFYCPVFLLQDLWSMYFIYNTSASLAYTAVVFLRIISNKWSVQLIQVGPVSIFNLILSYRHKLSFLKLNYIAACLSSVWNERSSFLDYCLGVPPLGGKRHYERWLLIFETFRIFILANLNKQAPLDLPVFFSCC